MSDFIDLPFVSHLTDQQSIDASQEFNKFLQRRRTVRDFSNKSVPKEVIEQCILAAGSAPSGAHMQPWHFVAISNQDIKSKIRVAAEAEEKEFYQHRASKEWLKALEPLGTDTNKPFLETAPWLIAVFAERYGLNDKGERVKHYYTPESVGISCGMLLSALHASGLVTLTHTPSPMGFLKSILKRPENERAFMLIVCGHPDKTAQVPNLHRKTLKQVSTYFE
jgi:nitroreductase